MIIDVDFSSLKLTGRTKAVCADLRDYDRRMRELHREPVYRVRITDYIAMRKFAEKSINDKANTLGVIRLDGKEVFRYDGE